MTSHTILQIEAAALHRCAGFLYVLAARAGAAANHLDTWLESRGRARGIRRDLSVMTARELRDIGLTRFDIEAIATGRFRRTPH
jgi:uncharacterized protein YjiS (DUF1127 family)